MKLYVGNLAFAVTDDELRQMFEEHGQVASASVVKDRFTDRPRGFAFVEMPVAAEAQAAVTALNGKSIANRTIEVSEARAPREGGRGPGGGGGGGRRPGGGGGGRPFGGGGGGGGRRF